MAGPSRILVVDDDENTRELIAAHLRRDEHRVLLASDGAEGLRAFEDEAPDLVLLDVNMPGMTGFEVCTRIRALANGAHVPILFLTAYPDGDVQQQATKSGGDDFLAKPVRRVELLMRVRSLLRMRDAEHQRRALVAMIVHDLKSPLAAALARDVLDDLDARERNDPELGDVLPEIELAAQRMYRMVLDILDVEASGAQAMRLQFAPIVAADLLAQSARSVSRLADMRKQRIEVDAPPSVRIEGDASLLRRIVDNLLDNALKYAPSSSTIRLDARDQGDCVLLKVSDQGTGVPKDMRERIFQPFARTPGVDPRAGHGLGLTFCKRAAEAHGGSIYVEERETGNAFCVKLPKPKP